MGVGETDYTIDETHYIFLIMMKRNATLWDCIRNNILK